MLHGPSYTFIVLNAITLVLVFKKVELKSLDWSWINTFIPTFLYLIHQMITNFSSILLIELPKDQDSSKDKVPKLFILDSLNHFLQYMVLFICLIIITELLETIPEQRSLFPLYIIATIYLLLHLAYTVLHSSIIQRSQPLSVNKVMPLIILSNNDDSNKPGISFFTSLITPLFNFLGSSVAICAGGTCTAIYGSTLSAIFSAFGITITEWLPYLDGLTGFLIIISVYVLYTAKRDWKYQPFVLSAVAATLIIFQMITSFSKIFLYVGNIMMILAALWNIRLNRVRLGKSKKSMV